MVIPPLYRGWWCAPGGKYHRLAVTEATDRPAVCGISIWMINDYKESPPPDKQCDRCRNKLNIPRR